MLKLAGLIHKAFDQQTNILLKPKLPHLYPVEGLLGALNNFEHSWAHSFSKGVKGQ